MSETAISQSRLERIRKLLETAENFAAKPGEDAKKTAENYREKAFEMAAGMEIEELLRRTGKQATRDEIGQRIFEVGRPYGQQVYLAHLVYKNSGARLVDLGRGWKNTSTGRVRKSAPSRVHVFGFPCDLDRADMLFTSLVVQATREAVRGYREYTDRGGAERRSVWYRSFWNGWLTVLGSRLEQEIGRGRDEEIKRQGSDTASTELAIRDRSLAVNDKVSQYYGKLRRGRGLRSSGSGFAQGREAGKRADLGRGKVGRTTRELEG